MSCRLYVRVCVDLLFISNSHINKLMSKIQPVVARQTNTNRKVKTYSLRTNNKRKR